MQTHKKGTTVLDLERLHALIPIVCAKISLLVSHFPETVLREDAMKSPALSNTADNWKTKMRTLFFSSLAANLRDVPEPVNILHHPQQIRIFLEVYRPDHTFGIYFPKRRQRRTARGLRSRARGMLVWIFRESFFFSLRTNPSTFLSLSASGRFVSKNI